MEMKSVNDFLNFIDGVILSDKGKHACVGNLEDLRDFFWRCTMDNILKI